MHMVKNTCLGVWQVYIISPMIRDVMIFYEMEGTKLEKELKNELKFIARMLLSRF